MYAEITETMFNRLVTNESQQRIKAESLEHAHKSHYKVDDVILVAVNNYLSCTWQYYIQDINA